MTMDMKRIREIYQEISRYEIKLEPDPTSLGPLYLNGVICDCRNYLNSVTRILLDIRKEKQHLTSETKRLKTSLAIESDDLLSKDEEIKKLPSIGDRRAAINMKLKDRITEIDILELQSNDLDQVEKGVKLRHSELRDTMAEIKLQRNLMRDEIQSGSFYGDENDRGNGSSPRRPDIVDEVSVDATIDEALRQAVATAKGDQPSLKKEEVGDIETLLSGVSIDK